MQKPSIVIEDHFFESAQKVLSFIRSRMNEVAFNNGSFVVMVDGPAIVIVANALSKIHDNKEILDALRCVAIKEVIDAVMIVDDDSCMADDDEETFVEITGRVVTREGRKDFVSTMVGGRLEGFREVVKDEVKSFDHLFDPSLKPAKLTNKSQSLISKFTQAIHSSRDNIVRH